MALRLAGQAENDNSPPMHVVFIYGRRISIRGTLARDAERQDGVCDEEGTGRRLRALSQLTNVCAVQSDCKGSMLWFYVHTIQVNSTRPAVYSTPRDIRAVGGPPVKALCFYPHTY